MISNTNKPNKAAIKKYRPVLTAVQIEKIIFLAKTETPISDSSRSLIGTLAPFLAKIQANAVNAAYTNVPPVQVSDLQDRPHDSDPVGANTDTNLYTGASTTGHPDQLPPIKENQEEIDTTTHSAHIKGNSADLILWDEIPMSIKSDPADKVAYWYECYAKYLQNPVSCTLDEIDAANEHKYLNDLMTPLELKAFEARSI